MPKSKKHQTVDDFGNQWQIHGQLRENHWTSDRMFRDHFPKDFDFTIFKGARVLEVGSGSGRILHMLAHYSPSELFGVEPSIGFPNLIKNTNSLNNVKLLNTSGSEFEVPNLDIVVSLGVIHHIPEAHEVVRNIYNSLKKGGYFLMWVYGRENNQPYVFLQSLIRKITRLLPDFILDPLSLLVSYLFDCYGFLSRIAFADRLPLSRYYKYVYSDCGRREKKYIIFDQLNPAYSKYYKKGEVLELLQSAGFEEINTYHRHGYSWTAMARK